MRDGVSSEALESKRWIFFFSEFNGSVFLVGTMCGEFSRACYFKDMIPGSFFLKKNRV